MEKDNFEISNPILDLNQSDKIPIAKSDLEESSILDKNWFKTLKSKCIVNLKNQNLDLLEKYFLHKTWKRLANLRDVSQQSLEWRKTRDGFITGSDVSKFLSANPYESKEQAIDKKSRGSYFKPNHATLHGNCKEPLSAKLLCYELDDIGFSFGFVPHPIISWLGMSPDITLLKRRTIGELKAPYYRDIITEEQEKELQPLIKELMLDGNAFRYRSITNLPIEMCGILEKELYNYHQMQLEMEVLQFDTDHGYYGQLGISPGIPYRDKDPLMAITMVKKDEQWLSKHVDELEKCWMEIQNQRKKEFKGFNQYDVKRVCPFSKSNPNKKS